MSTDRKFRSVEAKRFFTKPPEAFFSVDLCKKLHESAHRKIIESYNVEPKKGKAIKLHKGQVVRFSLPDGPQVCDINVWNKNNLKVIHFLTFFGLFGL